MKILVIEADPTLASYLKKGLTENSFNVQAAEKTQDVLSSVDPKSVDLVLVDLENASEDDWNFIRLVRAQASHLPLVALTSLHSVNDRIKGFDLGIDDFVSKPFVFSELLARIRSLLRRVQATPVERLMAGDLELDLIRHRCMRSGKRIDLTAKEFLLLSLLLRNKGQVLSRTVIAENVWDVNFESDTNFVDVHIRRLRSKIDDPFDSKLIRTVRGSGYVLDDR